ncbi:CLCA_X family protein [Echinimonas agarilytica]|uniref:Large polyvalent protein-associated domain-containing protein n=1 Tax=Echinimonas agarilytica TaxID=1215918 RepID=A0AA41W864_9GAMM|nr:CLCA_X family protein [Echinimonas agarilytica]MCM2680282.1 hypothetical protein [Echinimonas agarilytica]
MSNGLPSKPLIAVSPSEPSPADDAQRSQSAAPSNAPKQGRLHRNFYRRGPDYRNGDNVNFLDIKHQFSLGGLEVGRWVTKSEKQIAANVVFDALADLAFLLNIPPTALGLRGALKLAFGTGGQRAVQAHYAPVTQTLALAKNAGAGALAHEWWHAFDHHMATKLFEHPPISPVSFASTRWLNDDAIRPHPLNHQLSAVFAEVLLDNDGHEMNDFVKRSIALDRQTKRRYYSIPTEMMARAFEAWVQSQHTVKNEYLVSGTKQSDLAKAGGYPQPEHLQRMSEPMTRYFAQLGQAIG